MQKHRDPQHEAVEDAVHGHEALVGGDQALEDREQKHKERCHRVCVHLDPSDFPAVESSRITILDIKEREIE